MSESKLRLFTLGVDSSALRIGGCPVDRTPIGHQGPIARTGGARPAGGSKHSADTR